VGVSLWAQKGVGRVHQIIEVAAQEGLDKFVRRLLVGLERWSVLLEHATVKNRNAVSKSHRFNLVVRDVDCGTS